MLDYLWKRLDVNLYIKGVKIRLNKLVIIGNGFDLAHGLDTKYSDFFEKLIVPKYRDHFDKICKFLPKKEMFHSLETALAKFNDEKFYEERELEVLQNDLSEMEVVKNNFDKELESSLSFAEHMPIYLREWIREINTEVDAVLPKESFDKNSVYLSFNYTDTLEKCYDISPKQILYIHGKAKRSDDLILGHHEIEKITKNSLPAVDNKSKEIIPYNKYKNSTISTAQNIINSYYEKTYKDSLTIIKNNEKFFTSLSDIKEVSIYGHSLSKTDYDYFYEIKNSVSANCNWNISFHDKKDLSRAEDFIIDLDLPSYNLFKF
jgi:hypothetical protein